MNRLTELLPPADQTIDLKPCPFCGGKAEFTEIDPPDENHSYNQGFLVCCADEECKVSVVAGPCDTAAEAAEHWNTRKGWKL